MSPSAYRRDKGNGITFCYDAVVFYICFIDCDHGIDIEAEFQRISKWDLKGFSIEAVLIT
jgi:hypothetical protein